MDEKDLLADSIVKGIAYTENGGKLDFNNIKAGKTGEIKSIFQFTPGTWKLYAKSELGDENAEVNPDNETYVARQKVKKWIDKGYTARQIASMWNAGEAEKDAYTGKFSTGKSSVGINQKYGVKYDVPGYANNVLKYSKQFYSEKTNQGTQPSSQPTMTPQKNEAVNGIMSLIQKSQAT